MGINEGRKNLTCEQYCQNHNLIPLLNQEWQNLPGHQNLPRGWRIPWTGILVPLSLVSSQSLWHLVWHFFVAWQLGTTVLYSVVGYGPFMFLVINHIPRALSATCRLYAFISFKFSFSPMPFACHRDLNPRAHTFSSALKYILSHTLDICYFRLLNLLLSIAPGIPVSWLNNPACKVAGPKCKAESQISCQKIVSESHLFGASWLNQKIKTWRRTSKLPFRPFYWFVEQLKQVICPLNLSCFFFHLRVWLASLSAWKGSLKGVKLVESATQFKILLSKKQCLWPTF